MQKPKLSKEELLTKIADFDFDFSKYKLLLVGIHGYYKNSMGKPNVNDINIYDDAIFVVSKDTFASFNANTDPSKVQKSIATLQPGVYYAHKFDTHFGKTSKYPAICQRLGNVTVKREGEGAKLFTGMFGINIHQGGNNTTSSLGCQTVPPTQWKAFYELSKAVAVREYGKDWDKVVIPYILLEN